MAEKNTADVHIKVDVKDCSMAEAKNILDLFNKDFLGYICAESVKPSITIIPKES